MVSWRWLTRALAAAFIVWLLASFGVTWRLTRRMQEPYAEPVPAALAPRAESVRLTTRDGEELGAWYLPPARDDAPSVALFHGLGGTRASRLGAAKVFERAGCAALLVTHRCHGDSTGEREDFGWSERFDVVAAVEWLERRRPGARVLISGASLGAAAATFAAAELGTRVAGYVLECPYVSLEDAARRRTELFLPWGLDWLAFTGLRLGASVLVPNWSEIVPLDAVRAIPSAARVLILAGELDTRAPPDDARQLLASSGGQARLVVVPGGAHDRLNAASSATYEHAIRGLLQELEVETGR